MKTHSPSAMLLALIVALVAIAGVGPVAYAEAALPTPKPTTEARKSASRQNTAATGRINPNVAAKKLFGKAQAPAPLKARSIGSYARGCLAGGKALAADGPSWQVIRLSRTRNWGHPAMVNYLERLAADVPGLGWRGLMVGDMAQPRGGPMPSGHTSHQIGLDADIWLREMSKQRMTKQQRENVSAISMLKKGTRTIDKSKWTEDHAKLIRRAASDKAVARIFVHPAIKAALCDWAGGNRSWLRKIRPWYGHHYHFHVRISCPKGLAGCKDQAAPPPGDGCGKAMAWWLSDAPWGKPKKGTKVKKKRDLRLADLPRDCSGVLAAR